MTFAYENGDPKPYVLEVESPSRACQTYRWATARERDQAARRLSSRPLAVKAAKATGEPETAMPPAPAGSRTAAQTRLQTAAVTARRRAITLATTPFNSRTIAVASACATCGAAPLAVAAGAPAFVRFPLAVLFFCLVPGTAVLNLLGPSRVSLEPGLVVVVSLSISALTAQSMLWLGVWAPDAFLNALAAGSIAMIAAASLREQAAHG
jgi:hypothetical protein